MFQLSDYTFSLPPERIAETAAHPAHNAKLMVLDRDSGAIIDETSFWNLDQHLDPKSVLFFNDSRVIRARVPLTDIPIHSPHTSSLSTITDGEFFFLRPVTGNTFEALVRPGKKFRTGNTFTLGKYQFSVVDTTDSGRILKIAGGSIMECLEEYGQLPLPPYIEYSEEKEADYQSVFAQKNGSVAAPTASLHFTKELIAKIRNTTKTLTLHIGLGTFQPINTADIRDYAIHAESIEVSHVLFTEIAEYKHAGRNIIAVGTTACRTLESLPALWHTLSNEEKSNFSEETQHFWNSRTAQYTRWIHNIHKTETTFLFESTAYIFPGYSFQIIDELITNFHLPESSLLVLVSSLIGRENLLSAYTHAIQHQYRFFSF